MSGFNVKKSAAALRTPQLFVRILDNETAQECHAASWCSALSVEAKTGDSWIPGLAVLARNDGRVIFVIPALRQAQDKLQLESRGWDGYRTLSSSDVEL